MIQLIEEKREALRDLCRRFHVARLEAFGSAAEGGFDPARSDLDFLVTFDTSAVMGPSDQYFGLLFALQDLFGRNVDLVCASAMRNRFFIEEVNRTRQVLYAA